MAETTAQTAPLSRFGHLHGSCGSYPPSNTHSFPQTRGGGHSEALARFLSRLTQSTFSPARDAQRVCTCVHACAHTHAQETHLCLSLLVYSLWAGLGLYCSSGAFSSVESGCYSLAEALRLLS